MTLPFDPAKLKALGLGLFGGAEEEIQIPQELEEIEPVPEFTPHEIQPSQQIQAINQPWDWKTSRVGPTGEPLPDYALGWTPFGEPYFGSGLLGAAKKYYWKLVDEVVKPVSWDEISGLVDQYTESIKSIKESDQGFLEKQKEGALAHLGLGVGASKLALRETEQIPAARVTAVGVEAGLDLLQQPAIGTERALGTAYLTVQDLIENKQEDRPTFGENWEASRIFYSYAVDDARKEDFLRRLRDGEDPALLAMELQDPGKEILGQIALDPLNLVGWITKSLKGARTVAETEKLSIASGTVANPQVLKIVDEMGGAARIGDEVNASGKLTELMTAHMDTVKGIRASKGMVQEYGAFKVVAAGNRTEHIRDSAVMSNWIANTLRKADKADEIPEAFAYMIQYVSPDPDEAAKGLIGLLNVLPSPKVALSRPMIESGIIMRNLLTTEEGVVDASRLLKDIAQAKDPSELARVLSLKIDAAAKKFFPTVDEMHEAFTVLKNTSTKEEWGSLLKEMKKPGFELIEDLPVTKKSAQLAARYMKLPEPVKYIARIGEFLQPKKQAINSVLAIAYFDVGYGTAARNYINNTFTALVDVGIGAYYKDGKVLTPKLVHDMLVERGISPEAYSGYTVMAESEAKRLSVKGGIGQVWEKVRGTKKMEWGENDTASRLVLAGYDKTLKKMVPLTLFDAPAELGLNKDQIKHFAEALYRNHGDVTKAVLTMRGSTKGGKIDKWRMIHDLIPEEDLKAYRDMDFYDELVRLTENPNATRADVDKFFSDVKQGFEKAAAKTIKDPAQISISAEAAESHAELIRAVEDGYLPKEEVDALGNAIEQSEQASDKFAELLNEARQNAPFYMVPGADDAKFAAYKKIDSDYFKQTQGLSKATANAVRDKVKTTWYYTEAIRNDFKAGNPIVQYWDEIGLPGLPPADLSNADLKKLMLNNYWKQTKTTVGDLWGSYHDSKFLGAQKVMEEMKNTIDTSKLSEAWDDAYKTYLKAQQYRNAAYGAGGVMRAPATVFDLAEVYGIPTASEKGVNINKTVLKIINDNLPAGTAKYETVGGVKFSDAEYAFNEWYATKKLKGVEEGAEALPDVTKGVTKLKEGIPIEPPFARGSGPSIPRFHKESLEKIKESLDRSQKAITDAWGQVVDSAWSQEKDFAYTKYAKKLQGRMAEARLISERVGIHTRDFALHLYGKKTYADLALSYLLPYHFWYTRTYKNWLSRLATDPQVFSAYAKYKEYMEKIHAESPDWYKYQVGIKSILGMELDHPLIFNLESTIWPLYGLTGVDFNNPRKRVNWLTSTLDDVSKFGPQIWAPVQWAVAAGLQIKGEDEAAALWGGRVIPQSASVKSIMALAGVKPIDIDPAVAIFAGGHDSYDRSLVGRALGAMVQNKEITPEQAVEASRLREGDLWDEAYRRAVALRAPGQLMSFFAGVGFKARTPEDVEVDKFWNDYEYTLKIKKDNLSPEQTRLAYDQLRTKYPWMDTILLSKRGDEDRDAAYAYNVLSRLPPGQMGDLLGIVGINNKIVNNFYDSKGDINKWSEDDRSRFMGSIIALGAMLKLPDNATRMKWSNAKNLYDQMNTAAEVRLGKDILQKVDTYFTESDKDVDTGKEYIEKHPEVAEYFDLKNQIVAQTPSLYEYYGSLDTISAYFRSKMRNELFEKVGADIYDKFAEYDRLNMTDPTAAKAYKKAHPELAQYSTYSNAYQKQVNQSIVKFASFLPEKPNVMFREDYEATSETQKQLAEGMNQPAMTWEQWQSELSEPLQRLIIDYFTNGEELPYAANQNLDYLSSQYGFYDSDAMLQAIGLSLQRK